MKKIIIIVFFQLIYTTFLFSQKLDIGIFYGKFYTTYRYKDDGTGYRSTPKSQYSGYPSIGINKQFSKIVSGEATLSFMAYQQYTGTRLYPIGFFSVFYSGNISLTCNYSVMKTEKFETRLKAGVGIGIIPDQYQGTFKETFAYPVIDSISRGSIKRDFTPLFPTLCTGIDFSYKIIPRVKINLGVNYQKGFIRITEYDIYYNDGSGNNDQHAKQWGNGSFYAFYAGVRYILNKKKK